MITAQQIADALGIPIARAQAWFKPINDALFKFDINTPKRVAAFLAQIGHESVLLTHVEESLYYSADLLIKYFHNHFTAAEAEIYAHKPAAIANRAYGGRNGNGDEASGDGWKYRGRGLIQITFHDNYKACGAALGVDFVGCPELLTHLDFAALSAGWYWKSHGCNELADAGDMVGITKNINGGTNGLDQRQALYLRALPILTKGA
jgi:putative chitinase